MLTFFLLSTVKGLHVNFAPPDKPSLPMVLSLLLGRRFPKLFGFTEHDVKRLFPCIQKLVVDGLKETGYMHIQSTKPDTVGEKHNVFFANKLKNRVIVNIHSQLCSKVPHM